jgi:uncharacterized OB-fold protein
MSHVMDLDWANGIPLMVGPFQIGHAEPSPETKEYWDGIRQEKLLIKRCHACNAFQHPRRLFCTKCAADRFDWQQVRGGGVVYSFSTVHRAPNPDFLADVPYTVGLIYLDEGIYLFSRIVTENKGEPEVDDRVELFFQLTGPFGRLPAFKVVR